MGSCVSPGILGVYVPVTHLDVLKMVLNFVLGPPLPRGVPGEGPDCHFLRKSIVVGQFRPGSGGRYIFNLYFGPKRS